MRIAGDGSPLDAVSTSNTGQATTKSIATTELVEKQNTEMLVTQGDEQIISKKSYNKL